MSYLTPMTLRAKRRLIHAPSPCTERGHGGEVKGRPIIALAAAVLVALTLACQSEGAPLADATPTPTAAPQAQPVESPAPPAVDTATPTPSVVPAATATATPAPTATPTVAPASTPLPSPTPSGPAVTIGDVRFAAEVADDPAERQRGLSYRESLSPQTGMLFVFESGRTSAFWMYQMRFPLDFVWIGADCTVVDVTENVPNPQSPDENLPLYESSVPAAYTFEINAGEVQRFGIEIGDPVRFSGIDSPHAGC